MIEDKDITVGTQVTMPVRVFNEYASLYTEEELERHGQDAAVCTVIGVFKGEEGNKFVECENGEDHIYVSIEDFKEKCTLLKRGFEVAVSQDKPCAHDGFDRQFKAVTDRMNEMYIKKNHDYGNSFHELFGECGMTYAYGHIKEKTNRVKSLMGDEAKVSGESIKDSLMDLASYAVMTLIELGYGNE